MQKNIITCSQSIFTILLFNLGSSVAMGIHIGLDQDSWIGITLAALLSLPLFLIYARIIELFPGKDVFEIATILFGKIGGKVVAALFTWYLIHLAAIVLRNFSEATEITALPETPQMPIMILVVLTSIYLARSDIRAIGKWSMVMVVFVLFVVFLTFGVAIQNMRFDNLLPFMEHSPAQIAKNTFQVFSFPYAETVVFLCICSAFAKQRKPKTAFIYALVLIFIFLLLAFLRNINLLGRKMMEVSLFPSYAAARIIEIEGFFARIEGSISFNFLLAGIVKISVCLLGAAKGLASMFKLEHHRPVVLPAGMLSLALCRILFKNALEMVSFATYYPYYAFPFQVMIPLAIWITGEIYVRRHKVQNSQPHI